MTDVVLPLITKRCSMKKVEGDEALMESILLIFFGRLYRRKSGEHHRDLPDQLCQVGTGKRGGRSDTGEFFPGDICKIR